MVYSWDTWSLDMIIWHNVQIGRLAHANKADKKQQKNNNTTMCDVIAHWARPWTLIY